MHEECNHFRFRALRNSVYYNIHNMIISCNIKSNFTCFKLSDVISNVFENFKITASPVPIIACPPSYSCIFPSPSTSTCFPGPLLGPVLLNKPINNQDKKRLPNRCCLVHSNSWNNGITWRLNNYSPNTHNCWIVNPLNFPIWIILY